MTGGPYAVGADVYWKAGWRGIVPLPYKAKKNPPSGYTGEGGIDPSYADLDSWTTGPEGAGNIALRLPRGVIGLDVDAYGDKLGALTLSEAEVQLGTLPATWRTTSRDDGISGIRLYRVPEGLAWPGEIGLSTEIIQYRHRYAIVWPAVHPEGRIYRWINPDGVTATVVPDVDDLPALPDTWVEHYTRRELATTTARDSAAPMAVAGWLAGLEHAQGAMCWRMEVAVEQMSTDLRGSAHNSARDASLRAIRLATESHRGLLAALAAMRLMFVRDATSSDRKMLGKMQRSEGEAAKEWADLVTSAANLVRANPSGVPTCDCYGQLTSLILGSVDDVVGTDGALALNLPPAPEAVAKSEVVAEPKESNTRMKDGASFILDAPVDVPSVWGAGDEVLWSTGEALMIAGPPGVGKTTLTGQIVRGLLGLQSSVLGLHVVPTGGRVLYLAMDRPAQIARALRRGFNETERATLTENLRVWEGPPPGDIARHTDLLVNLAHLAGATCVIIDSLKDAAIGLTEDEIGAGYNRARQTALANGIQVLELHHVVKRGPNGSRPNTLADVYGSAWLTAGAGSVLLLWGAAGDPMVRATHLKQPAAEVGPFTLVHDHVVGHTSIVSGGDLAGVVVATGEFGISARDAARASYGTDDPTKNEIEKTRNKLVRLVKSGDLESFTRDSVTRWKGANVSPTPRQSTGFIHSPQIGDVGNDVGAVTSEDTLNVGDVGRALASPPTSCPPLRGHDRDAGVGKTDFKAPAKGPRGVVVRVIAGKPERVNLDTGEVLTGGES